jgi:DNA polymerase III subunit alpha
MVERAVELGWSAVALTDHGNMMAAPALYAAARAAKIKPILGCEMYVSPEDDLIDGDKEVLGERRHLTVLALSFEGYQNLVAWADLSMQRPLYYNGPRISVERMVEAAPHGLHHNVVLSGCLGSGCNQHLLHSNGSGPELARMNLQTLKDAFPNFYVELMNHEVANFMDRGYESYERMLTDQRYTTGYLLDLAQELGVPVIVTNDSHYRSPEQRRPHLAMMARKQWRRAADAHEGATKDATSDQFYAHYVYWSSYSQLMEPIAATLPEWAEKQAIESIHEIVAESDVHIEPLDVFSYSLPRAKSDDPIEEIRRRSKRRLKTMIARHGSVASERFDYELGAMQEFANYLLIYADIVEMARDQGVYTWTRGSACASLVCYCLGVHEIDPIHYQLLFERFVNPARAKFPDVDIDIEAHRRDDVAKMVVEYMHEIGQDVLPICTYSTLSNRNAFRLIAEAQGVPKERIDELAKLLPQMIDSGMVSSDEEAYEILREELGIEAHEDASALFDTIGGVSQHACAFAIGTKERPLDQWVPTYRIGSSDALVTQYNMKWIEAMGFLKLDLLRLDTLSILHSVARQLGEGTEWIDALGRSAPGVYDSSDEPAFQLLRAGRTDGVFTFQGATQRRGCIEVAPETTQDLVAIQALYRPGSTRTGVDKKFVARRRGEEEWEHLNEFTEKRWGDTYGLPIYQEQIMELGFDLGMSGEEVDDLYKAIKLAKGVGRGAAEAFANFEPTFRKHSGKKMPREDADHVWAEFDRMQGYSFNKAHATSFAVLGKKSAVCMAEHPLETFIAILERYPDNPRYIAAALQAGFSFEPPDVNVSTHQFSRGSDDKSIRVGFLRVEGIGPGAAGELVRNQPYASVEDLRERCNSTRVKQPTVEALRAIGAFESLGIDGDDDDLTQLRLLKMVLNKPQVFKGIKPSIPRRSRGTWEYLGLQRDLDVTFGKRFCSKLFWLPPEAKLELKAAASGHYSAWLLKAVDENGVPFDLMVGENKDVEVKLLKALAKMEGAVVCLDGQVGLPFLRGGDTSFRVWGVTRAEEANPQMWNVSEDDAKLVSKLASYKRELRRAA